MKNISFFYRRGALSSEIRGSQIGWFLGAKHNPRRGYQDDVCILVKMLPKRLGSDRGIYDLPESTYLDIIDYTGMLRWLRGKKGYRLIAASKSAETYLRNLCPNSVTFIPQHHCNTERLVRSTRIVKTVAYVGLMGAGPPPWYDRVNHDVRAMGMHMKYFTNFKTREDVVRAYEQTDIQFTWYDNTMSSVLRQMKTSLKIVNAASFGIPTVSSSEPAYVAECGGKFLDCHSLDYAMEALRQLQSDDHLYDNFVKELPAFAESYHIEHIAALYRRLSDE